MGYTFISYSSKNQSDADSLRILLNTEGINTWMAPYDISPGEHYASVINQSIKNCACFLVLLTEATQQSIWVPKEIERAVNYRKPIVPVQLGNVTLNDEFELYISTEQSTVVSAIDGSILELKNIISRISALTRENDTTEQRFVLVDESNIKLTYVLHYGSNVIGRQTRKSDVCLEDLGVSQIHAILDIGEQGATIKDLKTGNGTMLNGKKIKAAVAVPLHNKDKLTFGDISLIFCDEKDKADYMKSNIIQTSHL